MESNFARWNGKLDVDITPPSRTAYVTWWGLGLALWCLGYVMQRWRSTRESAGW